MVLADLDNNFLIRLYPFDSWLATNSLAHEQLGGYEFQVKFQP